MEGETIEDGDQKTVSDEVLAVMEVVEVMEAVVMVEQEEQKEWKGTASGRKGWTFSFSTGLQSLRKGEGGGKGEGRG